LPSSAQVAKVKLNEFRQHAKTKFKPREDDPSVVRSVNKKIQEWTAELGNPEFTKGEATLRWRAFNTTVTRAGFSRPAYIDHSHDTSILYSEIQFKTQKQNVEGQLCPE
jgi:hypothetical protein